MNELQWNAVWSMGVPDIDDQHRLMLGILKSFGDAAQIPDGGKEALACLHKYLENTKQHFSYEEAMLERSNYPGISGHKGDHSRYLDAVRAAIKLLEEFDGEAVSLQETIVEIKSDLQDLFTQHLVTFDMDYKWFLRDEGLSDPMASVI